MATKKRKAGKKAAKKSAKKAVKSQVRRTAAKKTRAKRKPSAAFMKPMTPTDVLASIIGNKPMPRTEVTKRVWDYIKKNKLQDVIKRTMINADEKMRELFGGKKQVSMFEMTKFINKHLK
ncbi:MAG: SWIB/MDM2 domain-containing protein [Burkholderiales bacterium]|nr:SWIB/MDM2 domain-containing protein [Burkholderiales bacterium]